MCIELGIKIVCKFVCRKIWVSFFYKNYFLVWENNCKEWLWLVSIYVLEKLENLFVCLRVGFWKDEELFCSDLVKL